MGFWFPNLLSKGKRRKSEAVLGTWKGEYILCNSRVQLYPHGFLLYCSVIHTTCEIYTLNEVMKVDMLTSLNVHIRRVGDAHGSLLKLY